VGVSGFVKNPSHTLGFISVGFNTHYTLFTY
jgi:hypothetical protein